MRVVSIDHVSQRHKFSTTGRYPQLRGRIRTLRVNQALEVTNDIPFEILKRMAYTNKFETRKGYRLGVRNQADGTFVYLRRV